MIVGSSGLFIGCKNKHGMIPPAGDKGYYINTLPWNFCLQLCMQFVTVSDDWFIVNIIIMLYLCMYVSSVFTVRSANAATR